MRLIKRLIYVVVVVAVLMAAIPLVTKWYLVRWLESEDYQVDIKTLRVNLFTGEVSLIDASLTSREGDRVKVYEALVNLDLLALLKAQIVLQSLKVDGGLLDVRSTQETLLLGGGKVTDITALIDGDLSLKVERIHITNSDLCGFSKGQCLRVGSAETSHVSAQISSNDWFFHHRTPLHLNTVYLRDLSSDAAVFYIGDLKVANAEYSMAASQLSEITVKNVQFVEHRAPVENQGALVIQTQVGELNVSSLSVNVGDDPEVILGDVEAISFRQGVVRRASDGLVAESTRSWFDGLLAAVIGDINGDPTVHLAFNKLSVQGGILSWRDTLVTPVAAESLASVQLQVGRIDTDEPNVPAQLKLVSKFEEGGQVKFEGQVYPFGPKPTVAGSGLIQGWNMSRITAYTQSMYGQTVNEGSVNVSFDVQLNKGRLDAETRWQLTAFDVDSIGGQHFSLASSLALLKDHNQSVRFSFPVVGDLSAGEISFEYIFKRLIGSTLRKMARQQVDAVGEGVNSNGASIERGDQLGQMVFRPIMYEVKSRSPTGLDVKRVSDIGAMLKAKSHLVMSFCPVITGGEWARLFNLGVEANTSTVLLDEQRQALMDLASARGKVLRRDLMNAGAEGRQIKLCDPRVDMSKLSESFITISM